MNASKIMFCAIGATLMTSATAFSAHARTVDGINEARNIVSDLLVARVIYVGLPASIDKSSSPMSIRIALNPQPLPPGRAR